VNLGGEQSQKGSFLRLSVGIPNLPERQGYRIVSKLVSKSKFQNLTIVMSFDTTFIYDH
jgi:hypothetical protein